MACLLFLVFKTARPADDWRADGHVVVGILIRAGSCEAELCAFLIHFARFVPQRRAAVLGPGCLTPLV
jgi:hypothetical protein